MKVIRNTPNQLIVEERPWLIGSLLIIAMLVPIGIGLAMLSDGSWLGLMVILSAAFPLLFVFIFVRRVQVVFHRSEGWVEIRGQTLRDQTAVRHDISEIEGASVQSRSTSDGTDTHRIVLHIPEGQSKGIHPLTQYYASGRGSHRVADAINDWLG